MRPLREEHRLGLGYLGEVTALLQRVRSAHPTAGLCEAADLQWWWRTPRSTDDLPQLFWFDDDGRPVAAVIATDWGDRIALAPQRGNSFPARGSKAAVGVCRFRGSPFVVGVVTIFTT